MDKGLDFIIGKKQTLMHRIVRSNGIGGNLSSLEHRILNGNADFFEGGFNEIL